MQGVRYFFPHVFSGCEELENLTQTHRERDTQKVERGREGAGETGDHQHEQRPFQESGL